MMTTKKTEEDRAKEALWYAIQDYANCHDSYLSDMKEIEQSKTNVVKAIESYREAVLTKELRCACGALVVNGQCSDVIDCNPPMRKRRGNNDDL